MKKYILLIGAAVLLMGAFAWAQGEYPGYGGPYGSYYGQNLNLTQDQQKEPADLDAIYLTDTRDESRSVLTDEQLNVDPYSICGLGWGGGMTGGYGRGLDGGTTQGWCW